MQHYIQQFTQCHKTTQNTELGTRTCQSQLSTPCLESNPESCHQVCSIVTISTELPWLTTCIRNNHKVKTDISQIIFLFSTQKSNLRETLQLHVCTLINILALRTQNFKNPFVCHVKFIDSEIWMGNCPCPETCYLIHIFSYGHYTLTLNTVCMKIKRVSW